MMDEVKINGSLIVFSDFNLTKDSFDFRPLNNFEKLFGWAASREALNIEFMGRKFKGFISVLSTCSNVDYIEHQVSLKPAQSDCWKASK